MCGKFCSCFSCSLIRHSITIYMIIFTYLRNMHITLVWTFSFSHLVRSLAINVNEWEQDLLSRCADSAADWCPEEEEQKVSVCSCLSPSSHIHFKRWFIGKIQHFTISMERWYGWDFLNLFNQLHVELMCYLLKQADENKSEKWVTIHGLGPG